MLLQLYSLTLGSHAPRRPCPQAPPGRTPPRPPSALSTRHIPVAVAASTRVQSAHSARAPSSREVVTGGQPKERSQTHSHCAQFALSPSLSVPQPLCLLSLCLSLPRQCSQPSRTRGLSEAKSTPKGSAWPSPRRSFSKRECTSVPARTFRRGPRPLARGPGFSGFHWLPHRVPAGLAGPMGPRYRAQRRREGFVGNQRHLQGSDASQTLCGSQQSRTDGNIPLPTHWFQAWRFSLSYHGTLWWVRKPGGCPCGRLPQQLRVQRTKVELEVGQDPFSFRACRSSPSCLILVWLEG